MKHRCLWILAILFGTGISSSVLADVRIAVAGPVKGQFAEITEQMRAGAQLAVSDINSAGGLLGETLVLEVADDNCTETQAIAVANQLIGKAARLVVGHVCFGSSNPASEVYANSGIVQISPVTTLPAFTELRPGPGIFRLAPRDDEQPLLAARLLLNEFAGRNIAFVHDKTAYGKGLVDSVKKIVNDSGVTEVAYQGFDAGDNSYRGLVARLALENTDVIYLGGYHPEAGLIKLEMERQSLDAELIAGDALMTDEYWAVTGTAGEGTLLTYPADPRDLPEAQSIVSALEEAEQSGDRYALASYAAVQAWGQAVEAAQSIEATPVISAMESGEFFTILGDFSFDDQGDAGLPRYIVYEWRNGKPVPR